MLDVALVLLATIQTAAAVGGLLHRHRRVPYPSKGHRHEAATQPTANEERG